MVDSRVYYSGLPEYIDREMVTITNYEIIMILLEVVRLPITTGIFIISFTSLSLLKLINKRETH